MGFFNGVGEVKLDDRAPRLEHGTTQMSVASIAVAAGNYGASYAIEGVVTASTENIRYPVGAECRVKINGLDSSDKDKKAAAFKRLRQFLASVYRIDPTLEAPMAGQTWETLAEYSCAQNQPFQGFQTRVTATLTTTRGGNPFVAYVFAPAE